MMQFLKSTLFPSIFDNRKSANGQNEMNLLKKRIKLLELENKKVEETIQDLSSVVRTMSFVITDLAAEVTLISEHFNSSTSASSRDEDIFNRYLMGSDDDDDGYLN